MNFFMRICLFSAISSLASTTAYCESIKDPMDLSFQEIVEQYYADQPVYIGGTSSLKKRVRPDPINSNLRHTVRLALSSSCACGAITVRWLHRKLTREHLLWGELQKCKSSMANLGRMLKIRDAPRCLKSLCSQWVLDVQTWNIICLGGGGTSCDHHFSNKKLWLPLRKLKN